MGGIDALSARTRALASVVRGARCALVCVGSRSHPTYPTLAILGAAFVLVTAFRLKIARVG